MGPSSRSEADFSLPSSDETLVEGDSVRQPEPTLGRGDEVDRYLLLDPLGRGAMGQVFRAYDPDLDRQVAIKILREPVELRPDARERLLGEAKAMARIHHPHVITVHDAGMHDGSVFIAMEIVDGPSLDRWLATPRSPAEILDALTDAARGLAAAHAAGVIHRDFKPANVLVGADGRAKVGDFGLAGIEDPLTSPATEPGHARAMGTPAYMSPEHFAGVGIDARSDQFSFGIALHEALHGTRPFSATAWPELAVQVTTGAMDPTLTARRGRIDGVVRRALAVDPAQRYPSMDALIAALERARRPRWHRWTTVAAVAVALGLGIVVSREPGSAEVCEPGSRRVETLWNEPAKAALRIGGSDYTEAFARGARERFERGLDDYAARWSTAYDESCAVLGPRATAGTNAERHVAECLENRFDSLRGLTQLATTEPLDADDVQTLVDTLPAIEDCTSSEWVPYPADPERAAVAAELYRRLDRILRARIADRDDGHVRDARAVVAEARELGEPYILATALRELALAHEGERESEALLDEALELAVAGGHDRLTANVINAMLITARANGEIGTHGLGHLMAVARGSIARGGGDEALLGHLSLQEGSVLRRLGLPEQALVCDRRAEDHYLRADDDSGVARARANQLASLLRLGKGVEISQEIPRVIQAIEAADGASSPTAFQARMLLVAGLSYGGQMREAQAAADAAFRYARELYTPRSETLREAAASLIVNSINTGETDVVRETIAFLRESAELPEAQALDIDIYELLMLELEGRHEPVLRRIPALVQHAVRLGDIQSELTLITLEARNQWLLGQEDAARRALTAPAIARSIDRPELYADLRADLALIGALSGATPPAGHTWGTIAAAEDDPIVINRRMASVVRSIESDADPTATVRRVRAEVIGETDPRDVDLQLLDAWLAAHAASP